jgi:hypothetical protein
MSYAQIAEPIFLPPPVVVPIGIPTPNAVAALGVATAAATAAANQALLQQEEAAATEALAASQAATAATLAAAQVASAKAAIIAPTGQTGDFTPPGTAAGTVGSLTQAAANTGLLSPAGEANLAAAAPSSSTPAPAPAPIVPSAPVIPDTPIFPAPPIPPSDAVISSNDAPAADPAALAAASAPTITSTQSLGAVATTGDVATTNPSPVFIAAAPPDGSSPTIDPSTQSLGAVATTGDVATTDPSPVFIAAAPPDGSTAPDPNAIVDNPTPAGQGESTFASLGDQGTGYAVDANGNVTLNGAAVPGGGGTSSVVTGSDGQTYAQAQSGAWYTVDGSGFSPSSAPPGTTGTTAAPDQGTVVADQGTGNQGTPDQSVDQGTFTAPTTTVDNSTSAVPDQNAPTAIVDNSTSTGTDQSTFAAFDPATVTTADTGTSGYAVDANGNVTLNGSPVQGGGGTSAVTTGSDGQTYAQDAQSGTWYTVDGNGFTPSSAPPTDAIVDNSVGLGSTDNTPSAGVQALIDGSGSTSMTPTPGNPDPLAGYQPASTDATLTPGYLSTDPGNTVDASVGLGTASTSPSFTDNQLNPPDNTVSTDQISQSASDASQPLAFINQDATQMTSFDPNTGDTQQNNVASVYPPAVGSASDYAKAGLVAAVTLTSQGRASGLIPSQLAGSGSIADAAASVGLSSSQPLNQLSNLTFIGRSVIANPGPLGNVATDITNQAGVGPAQGPANDVAAFLQGVITQGEGQPNPDGTVSGTDFANPAIPNNPAATGSFNDPTLPFGPAGGSNSPIQTFQNNSLFPPQS